MLIEVLFDGACEPNPNGQMAYGSVIYKTDEDPYYISELYNKPHGTNNIAEYVALIASLKYLLYKKYQNIETHVFGDSQLVIKQMEGKWRLNDGLYIPYAEHALKLKEEFASISFIWISKKANEEADKLSRRFL